MAKKRARKRQVWNKGLEVGKRDGFTPAQVKRIRDLRYPPLAAVLRSGADPSSVSTGANTVICTGARDGRCDERS
jgi:hypothetical protein